MSKVLETHTIDEQRKSLYSRELKKKIISKSIYMYMFIPIRKSTQSTKIESKVFNNLINSKIISLFSAYTFFYNYFIQGPRINILITQSLIFEKVKELQNITIFICYISLKWYAFFILLEINLKYQLLFNLCRDFKYIIEIYSITFSSCKK